MVIKILLLTMGILFGISLVALFILEQYYKNICEANSQLKNRLEERKKEEERAEVKKYRIVTKQVKMDKVGCSISIPREIENKEEYVAAIAKDWLWDSAKDRAFYEERYDPCGMETVVNLYWFINSEGEKLGRDSFL